MAGVCLFMLEQVAALAQATARGQGAGPTPHREPFRGRPRGAGLSLVQVSSAVTGECLRTGHRGLGRGAAYLTSTKSPGAVAEPVVVVPANTKR